MEPARLRQIPVFAGFDGALDKAQRNATMVATSPMRPFALTGWDIRRSVVAERRDHA